MTYHPSPWPPTFYQYKNNTSIVIATVTLEAILLRNEKKAPKYSDHVTSMLKQSLHTVRRGVPEYLWLSKVRSWYVVVHILEMSIWSSLSLHFTIECLFWCSETLIWQIWSLFQHISHPRWKNVYLICKSKLRKQCLCFLLICIVLTTFLNLD